MENYPGAMGKGVVAAWEKAYPGASLKQVTAAQGGDAAIAEQILRDQNAFDMLYGTGAVAGQLSYAKAIQRPTFSKIPNARYIEPHFRQQFPWGVCTDWGFTGLAYRKDLISERPQHWADLWTLAKKYPNKTIFIDYDTTAVEVALLTLGLPTDHVTTETLNRAKTQLMKLKPYLFAIETTDLYKHLLTGDCYFAVTENFEIAAAMAQNKNVALAPCPEGVTGYVEGWIPVKGTKKMNAIEHFMNFAFEPKRYASFVNTTTFPYTMPAAAPYLDKSLRDSPLIQPQEIRKIKFVPERFYGKYQPALAQVWESVKA
jgi:spermidine/putrescine transport system substrate-binding protein